MTFGLDLSNPTNAVLEDAIALGSVADASATLISVNDAGAREGNDLTFTIALSRAMNVPLTVNFTLVDGTTSGNADFATSTNSVLFTPGLTEHQVVLTTNVDGVIEGDEQFTFVLSRQLPTELNVALNETLAVGTGTILENHAPLIQAEPIELTAPLGSQTVSTILSGLFSDSDGDVLSLSIAGNSNPNLVTGLLQGEVLLLTFAPDANGVASISIRATDPLGAYVEIAIPISVDVNNVPPNVALISALDVDEGSQATVINLTAYFSDGLDPNNDLIFFATSVF